MKFLSRCDFLLHFLCVIPYYFALSFYRRRLERSALKQELQILKPDISQSDAAKTQDLFCFVFSCECCSEEPLLLLKWVRLTLASRAPVASLHVWRCVTCTCNQHLNKHQSDHLHAVIVLHPRCLEPAI